MKNVIWQKIFYKAEDVPYAASVIKVVYLKGVSVPEDKELSFCSQPSKKDKNSGQRGLRVLSDAQWRVRKGVRGQDCHPRHYCGHRQCLARWEKPPTLSLALQQAFITHYPRQEFSTGVTVPSLPQGTLGNIWRHILLSRWWRCYWSPTLDKQTKGL